MLSKYERELLEMILTETNKLRLVHTALIDLVEQIDELKKNDNCSNDVHSIDLDRAKSAINFEGVY